VQSETSEKKRKIDQYYNCGQAGRCVHHPIDWREEARCSDRSVDHPEVLSKLGKEVVEMEAKPLGREIQVVRREFALCVLSLLLKPRARTHDLQILGGRIPSYRRSNSFCPQVSRVPNRDTSKC
jgi:hypothetical protein